MQCYFKKDGKVESCYRSKFFLGLKTTLYINHIITIFFVNLTPKFLQQV